MAIQDPWNNNKIKYMIYLKWRQVQNESNKVSRLLNLEKISYDYMLRCLVFK